ncbi:MAG: BatA domain-containing protein [bacterium]
MGLSFLAPLFFAGLSLLAVPWIVHRIRRPERETVRFSSLMFVPRVQKEVIERRKVQHVLLMLLRMLLLVLLVAAFLRPYILTPALAQEAKESEWHVILLDLSYSMGTGNHFAEAKQKAGALLDSLKSRDRVGVIGFAEKPLPLAPWRDQADPEAGAIPRARRAVDSAKLTEEKTAFLPALRLAQDWLLAEQSDTDRMRIIHLVSDLQRAGMPEDLSEWKLSPRIELDPIEVGTSEGVNYTLTDMLVRPTPAGELRIQGKIRNWSAADEQPRNVRLFVDGIEAGQAQIPVKPGNATQVSFTIPAKLDRIHEGWLEIGDDALALDNKRFFAWNPPRQLRLLILADPQPEKRWPAAWFLERALSAEEYQPWTLRFIPPAEFTKESREGGPAADILIAGDLNGLAADTAERILATARQGGQVFMFLNQTMTPETLNAFLLPALGLHSAGFRYSETSTERFDLLSWIDFEHPIFRVFQGSQLNDFSPVHFNNYVLLEPAPGSSGPKVLARLEGDSSGKIHPAMLEIPLGEGQVILWAFSPDLEWSNLPKSPKFVPLLYETLFHLAGGREEKSVWLVGEQLSEPPPVQPAPARWSIQPPGSEAILALAPEAFSQQPVSLEKPGWLRWRAEDQTEWARVDSVNVNAAESNPARVPPEELTARLCTRPKIALQSAATPEKTSLEEDAAARREFGRVFLVLLFIGLLVESGYASRLAAQEQEKAKTQARASSR